RRIIETSSNKGDVVLDPFCGCGTSIHAAAELKRQWIGIDVSYYAVRLVRRRLQANLTSRWPYKLKAYRPILRVPKYWRNATLTDSNNGLFTSSDANCGMMAKKVRTAALMVRCGSTTVPAVKRADCWFK